MTLTLYLVRHAEAEQNEGNDFIRELTPSGKTAAEKLGKQLYAQHWIPDVIISSPATRAITTANILAKEMQQEQHLQTEELMYNAEMNTLQTLLQKLPPHYQKTMLVGHNPGISALANLLSAQALPVLSPCQMYVLQFSKNTWKTVQWHSGTRLSLALLSNKNTSDIAHEPHSTRHS